MSTLLSPVLLVQAEGGVLVGDGNVLVGDRGGVQVQRRTWECL